MIRWWEDGGMVTWLETRVKISSKLQNLQKPPKKRCKTFTPQGETSSPVTVISSCSSACGIVVFLPLHALPSLHRGFFSKCSFVYSCVYCVMLCFLKYPVTLGVFGIRTGSFTSTSRSHRDGLYCTIQAYFTLEKVGFFEYISFVRGPGGVVSQNFEWATY